MTDAINSAFDGAQPLTDPLDGLVEKTKKASGSPLEPDALAALAKLEKENLPAFETLRTELLSAGCRGGILDKAIAKINGKQSTNQADVLVGLCADLELFHTPDGTAFVDVEVNGHRETWQVRSKGFRSWLTRQYFELTGGALNSEALKSATGVMEAKSQFDAPEREIFVRVAGHNGKIYIDLADAAWRAVEVCRDGWRVVDAPPVRFKRSSGMLPLPAPVTGGSVDMLRPYLNVDGDDNFVLVIAWLLAALRECGPYPLIVIMGEQGSAKSNFSKILRLLVDPNTANLRSLPRDDQNLFIAATNSFVLAFDNISGIPGWISDTLCRLATGGGYAQRQLYTDGDEIIFEASRPIILNGIGDVVSRPDLADRAIIIDLLKIPDDERKEEKKITAAFDKDRPKILGALLDAVSCGLREHPTTTLDSLPRMADFALWATACEGDLWEPGTFIRCYDNARDEATLSLIENDPVGEIILKMATETREVTLETLIFPSFLDGTRDATMSDFLDLLCNGVQEEKKKEKNWPKNPTALSKRLTMLAPLLRTQGIEIEKGTSGETKKRYVRVYLSDPIEKGGNLASLASLASPSTENGHSGDARGHSGDAREDTLRHPLSDGSLKL
jgi:hypothetical protein